MKHISLALAALGIANAAPAAERPVSRLSFQDVALNASFAMLDPKWIRNCVQSKETRRDFCLTKAVAGDVPLTVEIAFLDGYVNSIYVSFPSTEYETMFSALRIKNGREDVRTPATARWWSHSPGGADFPDSVVIRKVPERKPKIDGVYWLQGTEYSEITYSSAWTTNNPVDSVPPEQKRKAQEASRGL